MVANLLHMLADDTLNNQFVSNHDAKTNETCCSAGNDVAMSIRYIRENSKTMKMVWPETDVEACTP